MTVSGVGNVLAELPRTGQLSCFDQQGEVVEHTATGQDGDLQAGVVWPEPRFKDNGDGTVSDNLTGLMWLQNGNCLGRLSWHGALETAEKSTEMTSESCPGVSLYDDWTVPEITELESLFNAEEASADHWLNRHRFRNIQASGYWSRTTAPNPYTSWVFRFDTGGVEAVSRVELRYCLLVRKQQKNDSAEAGGHAVDVQDDKDGSGILQKLTDLVGRGEATTPNETLEPTPAPRDNTPRFIDNGNGTVTDVRTGLMWLKDAGCLGRRSTWQEALSEVVLFNKRADTIQCRELSVNFSDWALPNRNELRSIIDHRNDLPALPDNPFIGLQPRYWTSTTAASQTSSAYAVFLGSGELSAVDKMSKRSVWAVRYADGRTKRPRVQDVDTSLSRMADYYLLQTLGPAMAVKWPVKRFTDNGDGTLTDNITGLMWLKDGNCFKPEKKKHAGKVIEWLNTIPEKLKCEEYSAGYENWQLPEMSMLADLMAAADGEPAAWLNSQGAVNLIPRDYWTAVENTFNLYHAWAYNFRQGTPRNYPESFELHVWAVRKPDAPGPVRPQPSLLGNGKTGEIVLRQGEKITLSATIENVTGPVPSTFRIWYVAPDGIARWLTPQGEWEKEKEAQVYHGKLFHLDESPIFYGDTSELELGTYVFYFSISPEQGQDDSPEVFKADLKLTMLEVDESAGGDDEIDSSDIVTEEVRDQAP